MSLDAVLVCHRCDMEIVASRGNGAPVGERPVRDESACPRLGGRSRLPEGAAAAAKTPSSF